MSDTNDPTDGDSAQIPSVLDRRRLMQALGAGAAVTALGANAVAAGGTSAQDDLPADRSSEEIHPAFGFAALSMDVEPPVEPDHVVEAETRPREDREIPEFFFEPTGLYIEPGDTVQFSLVSPHHSVTAYHPAQGIQQRVPDDVPPFSSPVLPVNAYWLYTFDRPGVYDLHCGPHEIFGHVIRIVAGEATGPGAEPVPEPEPMAEPETDSDPEEMPDEGTEQPEHENGPNGNGDENGTGEYDDPDETDPDPEDEAPPEEGPEPRPPVGAALTVFGDPALEPERIVERERVSWEEIDDANKQIML
ncbi:plastocyanin [Natronorubrum sp. JWXQ-INN-674]|uniref:Plastocyanin n=1 Tax=Natronorubrum halalkaliphilum TaxID=2691917 RepID=A0A6B0VP51_9EURY|nr:plastocyanin [Natronorubrum halalkaliphilum]MXV62907.1 plastocyanin [Natronorubrum halalkaliphilum]